ncbi:GNAT family N-acetyltransferase [Lishizhenia sp.]|uniref:GNAT family N-acetyltransferase n=1 Tax=Lishizhenia sp. TaxID=2497594 RepID=UPI00299F0BA5|nr:GNAT family N-acetyltransferase [Lishizhenia sp.]MDX1447031.1 GNAT family N-acetyltransferase [Lishizhenia sp.]
MFKSLPRLEIKTLAEKDFNFFVELVSAPEIVNPVPHLPWSEEKIATNFKKFSSPSQKGNREEPRVWGVFEKGKEELIGLCALLSNDENQPEIGYRFRQKYWGNGYATEVTEYLIQYAFEELQLDIITADVNIKNTSSVKVLEKFFTPDREFDNLKENCRDRRYILKRKDWMQR